MEIKQLQYFVVSVETGAFSKAAEVLFTTQPNISKNIKKLEGELGFPILERGRKGVEITEQGKEVYEQAKNILKSLEIINEIIKK